MTEDASSALYSLEAEQTVLGAIILKPSSLDEIPDLYGGDFFDEVNMTLFDTLRYMYDEGKPIDLVHLTQEYLRYGEFDSVPRGYFKLLADNAYTAANITYYAEIIRQKAVRRRGAGFAEQVRQMFESGEKSEQEVFTELEQGFDDLRPQQKSQLLHVKKLREPYFTAKASPQEEFVKTGFDLFDEWGGGYARKSLIVKAGRPGVGKTAEALQECFGMATEDDGAGAIFSQEMTYTQVLDRMCSSVSAVNYTRIRRKWFMQDADETKRVNEAFDKLEAKPLYIRDTSGLTIQDIRADCRRLKREVGKLAYILIDYLTLMKITVPKGGNYAKAVGDVVWRCKMMAQEFDCPLILICMMGRSGEGTSEPKLSDLKESGDIEQHADMVEFLWIDSEDPKHADGTIVTRTIAKGRDTGVRTFKQILMGHIQRFKEYTPPPGEVQDKPKGKPYGKTNRK